LSEVQIDWPAGVKRTRQRESVMSMLECSDVPLSAADISFGIEKNGGDAVWLSTVYRTLELFVSKGVVVKTNVAGSEMAVYEINRFRHKHYAVCMKCRKIVAMDNCPLEAFVPNLKDESFHVTGHNLEIFGFCKDCEDG